MSGYQTFRWLLLAFGLGLPGVAVANTGIPMISLTLPFMAIVLVPIKVARRMLPNVATAHIDKAIWRVNLFSYGLLELLALSALAYALLGRARLI